MTTNKKSIGLSVSKTMQCARRSGSAFSIAVIVVKGLCIGLLAASFTSNQTAAADDAVQLSSLIPLLSVQERVATTPAIEKSVTAQRPKRADFKLERASPEARYVADWVVDSRDNRSMPFVIVDKTNAKVFVFEANGRIRGAAPALLGMARGDDSVPGIGDRKLSSIRPEERTTPAGRFVASMGRNLAGHEVLWVDYDGAISLHRVVSTNLKEHRLQRLATPTPLDNRISYGCINVPGKFFDNVVRSTFRGTNGIVYVLPETRMAREVFGSYDVDEHARQQKSDRPVHAPVPSGAARH